MDGDTMHGSIPSRFFFASQCVADYSQGMSTANKKFVVVKKDSKIPVSDPVTARNAEEAERKITRSGTYALNLPKDEVEVVETTKAVTGSSMRRVVEAITVLGKFDRIQLSILLDMPYGTVSANIVHLMNGGYVEELDEKVWYDRADFGGKDLNYCKSSTQISGAGVLRKTAAWSRLVTVLRPSNT